MLLDALSIHKRLSVTEAAELLGVPAATVRRDFEELARQQLATRTHGGVVATTVAYDLPARYRIAPGDPRERIAHAAAELVRHGEVRDGFPGRSASPWWPIHRGSGTPPWRGSARSTKWLDWSQTTSPTLIRFAASGTAASTSRSSSACRWRRTSPNPAQPPAPGGSLSARWQVEALTASPRLGTQRSAERTPGHRPLQPPLEDN